MASKGIVNREIAMHKNAGKVIIDAITIAPRTIVLTAATQMSLLLKLTLYEEQEGDLRN